MKTNLTLISFLERIYTAKKNNWKVDWKALLDVQMYHAKLEKENRDLKILYNEAIKRNVKMESKVLYSASNESKLKSRVDVSEGIIKSLKEEIEELTNNIEL